MPADDAILDVPAMREMASECGWSLVEFIELYLRDARYELGRLREAVRAGSTADASRVAHSLAGSSATAGIPGMDSVLRRIEAAGGDADLAALLRDAERQFERVAAALGALET